MPPFWRCNVCGKYFKLPGSLTRHRRRFHVSEHAKKTIFRLPPGYSETNDGDKDSDIHMNMDLDIAPCAPSHPPPLEPYPCPAGIPITPISYVPHDYERSD